MKFFVSVWHTGSDNNSFREFRSHIVFAHSYETVINYFCPKNITLSKYLLCPIYSLVQLSWIHCNKKALTSRNISWGREHNLRGTTPVYWYLAVSISKRTLCKWNHTHMLFSGTITGAPAAAWKGNEIHLSRVKGISFNTYSVQSSKACSAGSSTPVLSTLGSL